jgi:peptidoglycan/xylan/chitin deacetylase (PgdA/CDA1 family)
MSTNPPSSYPFVPLPDRKPLRFPGGARVAVILTINIEYWEQDRPGQKEPMFPGGPATIPHALPGDVWDTANWTWREYGQRIGIWRLIETFEEAGIAPSCTFNGLLAVERRRIFDEIVKRGWELVPHNWAQNDLLTYYAGKPEEEKAVIRRTLDVYKSIVGKPAKAWLSSAIRGSRHTPAILKEAGVVAYCDYLNDDQPYLIDTVNGPIVCVPYSNDVNDFNMFARGAASTRDGIEMLKACFDQLHKEGAKTGRIMNFGLHPHVIGQPHRIAALAEFLTYVKSKDGVWLPTREEIATWYLGVAGEHITPSSR